MRRLLPLALLAPMLASILALGGVATPAQADPRPPIAQYWPRCGTAPDDDGRYCLVSVTKDGVAVPPVDYSTNGVYDDPYVDLIGDGTVRFGLYRTTVSGSGTDSQGDVEPGHTWVYTVNTGSIRPNEMWGNVRDVDLALGGNATSGYTFTLTFKPSPIAWRLASGFSCSYDAGCGDDTTLADTVYDGFVTGYVTDDADSGLGAAEVADRHGYVQGYNAQDAYPFYDADTNTLEIRMANPHLRTSGVPATGYYDTVLPNAYLTNQMNVPDPTTLTGGSLTVVRTGSSGSVPFTVTHESGGVRIHISGITFSRPRYRIHPKPTAPGTPRWGSVHRVAPHQVRVSFRRPRADGGKPVTTYQARCRSRAGTWRPASRASSPIVVGQVPRRGVSCQVRARNAIGWGHWSTARHE